MPAFHFRLDEKDLKTEFIRDNVCDFRERVLLKHKSRMTGDCCDFKFLRHSVNRKHKKHF